MSKVRIEPVEAGTDQPSQPFVLASKSFNIEALGGGADSGTLAVDMKSLLVQMTNAMRSQHDEIENLKKHQITSQLQLKAHIDSTLKQMSASQQQQAQQHNQATAHMHQELKKDLANMARPPVGVQPPQSEMEARLVQAVRDEVGKVLRDKLVEPVRAQLARDLAEQLKAIDASSKDHVSKLFKSKSMLDAISAAVAQAVQPAVVNSYRDTFQKVIVPNFEKSCQSMYQQVNASFAKGTQVQPRRPLLLIFLFVTMEDDRS